MVAPSFCHSRAIVAKTSRARCFLAAARSALFGDARCDFYFGAAFLSSLITVAPCVAVIVMDMNYIMSFNQPTSNDDSASGMKRPLENEIEGDGFAFVVSQEMNDDEHNHDAGSNKRHRTMEPESPGVVSISSNVMDRSAIPQGLNNDFLDMSVDSKPWWKQQPIAKHPPAPTSATTAQVSCCFICQRPRHQQKQPSSYAQAPLNSLHSYFATTKTSGGMDKKLPAAPMTETKFQKCSFCDRQACTSCNRTCERCQQYFCSLCSTADYNSRLERSFCLDCFAIETRESDETSDMNIG